MPADSAGASPPIDAAAFRATWRAELAAQRPLLEDYARSNAEDIDALRGAVAQRRLDDVQRGAHRLAGAGQIIAALDVVAASRRVESAARAADWPALEASLPGLYAAVARVDAFIRSL